MKAIWLAMWLCAATWAAEPVHPEFEGLAKAVDQANAGDRKAAVATLDALIRQFPDLVDARVLRGLNRYLLGDEAGARTDLAWAFSGARWEHVHISEDKGQEIHKTVTSFDLTEQRVLGAATLVLMEARGGAPAAGKAVLAKAVGTFGDEPRLKAAEARMLLAEARSAEAWAALQVALRTPDATGLTASIASEMAALDPRGAPRELFDAMASAGQWTAVYNRARALVGERRYKTCAEVVGDGLKQFDQPKLLALGYTCAARSDPATASAWLADLGGPRRAEPADVVAHARTLAEQGQHAAAVELLQQLPKKLPDEHARTRHRLLLEAHLALGRLDDALKISDGTAPTHETRLAHALIGVERIREARALLERACPALGDDPARPACDQLLEWARAR